MNFMFLVAEMRIIHLALLDNPEPSPTSYPKSVPFPLSTVVVHSRGIRKCV